jgi:hypothetical protein
MAALLFRNIFGTQVLMVLYFSSLAAGFNTTAPLSNDQPLGWQAGGDNRSTWAIVSSCLSTIFAGTWSIQHLNVPGKNTSDGKWARKFRSCKWMVVNILFPEFIVLRAAFEFLMAMQAFKLMADNNKAVANPWWYRPRHRHDGGDSEDQKPEEVRKWTLTHCFFANMGGLYYEHGESRFPLTALQLAVQQNGFDNPEMLEEDIEDKSKQDWFAKGIAALQFSQLALSLVVRTNQGLDFSQLETITLGFAVCGALVYLIYLYKPQNVETPIMVKMRVTDGLPIQYERTYDSFWEILTNKRTDTANINVVDRIPNDNIPIVRNSSVHPGVFLLALSSGLFGAMHAIAWKFEFPTRVERILWRTATVIAAVSPMVGLITIPFAQLTVSSGNPQDFMADCLRLLREFSWHTPDKDVVDRAYNELEQIYIMDKTDDGAKRFYKSIFSETENQPPQLGKQLLKFIESSEGLKKTPLVDLHPDFIKQFRSLCDLMEEKDAKKLCETAQTNVFPRKNLLPKAFNFLILSLTSTLYCLSRLSLLAISLSSLRRMPKSVYLNTPWTKYIPSLGSMS